MVLNCGCRVMDKVTVVVAAIAVIAVGTTHNVIAAA
ncbi:hypothetical protein A2U01_0065953, partial [Trifolium medium]|nr:hypothetical protein [Trifolium medium]